jgi:pimeloyl-ACP methyl ester carboxylesterase
MSTSSAEQPATLPVRSGASNSQAAIVFIHGFTGSGQGTWKDLSGRIAGNDNLATWDIWTMTYGSSWFPDVSGIWSADAALGELALRLRTDLSEGALKHYGALTLIAHSMGGLIVQRALLSYPDIAERTATVILFGTPSAGLVKARTLRFWKSQLSDMAADGPFIADLRADWDSKFGKTPPFSFLAVAGESDQFVPPKSSIQPFPDGQRAVVPGNHVSMIHPPAKDPGLVKLIANRIMRKGPAGNVPDSALVALELGQFKKAVRELEPHADEIDKKAVVHLAIALEALGQPDKAKDVLTRYAALDSDVLGTIGGRFKRRWLFSGRRKADAETAEENYKRGYAMAQQQDNRRQAYYHGINLAFLAMVYRDDRKLARTYARDVLDVCGACQGKGEGDEWLDATEGEAHLILNDIDASKRAYERFVNADNNPWKIGSTYLNARMIARTLGNRELAKALGQLFGDPNP